MMYGPCNRRDRFCHSFSHNHITASTKRLTKACAAPAFRRTGIIFFPTYLICLRVSLTHERFLQAMEQVFFFVHTYLLRLRNQLACDVLLLQLKQVLLFSMCLLRLRILLTHARFCNQKDRYYSSTRICLVRGFCSRMYGSRAVSYTHLTLPTTAEV